jgi:hypothetical protein
MEFSQNNKVSFTTIPVGNQGHVRVINGIISESDLKLSELVEMCTKKYPDMEKTSPQSDMMKVYELRFDEAEVVLGMNQRSKIIL